MPFFAYFVPFMPFLAMVPPSLAAMWIASRWLKNRRAVAQVTEEMASLREELAVLRQEQAEMLERLDLSERMLSQMRQAPRELR